MSILGIGLGLAGTVMGAQQQNRRNTQAYKQQQNLMDIQYNNQRLLNQQGNELQYDMWKKTNAPAQVGMLKKAGLNPALMYGGGGAGGTTTTGSQGGGTASGGNAPSPMDIGNAVQAGLAISQIKVNEAKAKELEANADSTRGEEGTIGEQQILTEGAKQELMKFEAIVAQDKSNNLIEDSNLKGEQRWDIIKKRQAIINNLDQDTMLKEIKARAEEKGIEYTDEKINEIWHSIRQKWVSVGGATLSNLIGGAIKMKAPKGKKSVSITESYSK